MISPHIWVIVVYVYTDSQDANVKHAYDNNNIEF